jgi:hypothetical protein
VITAYVIAGILCLIVGFRLGSRYERRLLCDALDTFKDRINNALTAKEAEQIVRDFASKRSK